MINKVRFAGHFFDDVWPDPEGDIPVAVIPSGLGGLKIRAGVEKGCSYTPGMHPYLVTVTVIEGRGLFFLNEDTVPYAPGSIFEVGAYVPHSFIKVERDTVFTKDIPRTAPV